MSDSMLERRSLQYDKSAGLGEFHLPLQFYSSFIKKQVRTHKINFTIFDKHTQITSEKLTCSQKLAFGIYKKSYESGQSLKLGIISYAGSGKTEYIRFLQRYVADKVGRSMVNHSFVVLTFTGSAAFLLGACTIYSFSS